MAALKLSESGHSSRPPTASRPAATAPAASHRPARWHAAHAVLKLSAIGATPAERIASSSSKP
eukprot:643179-Prymnesium_polylepis.2